MPTNLAFSVPPAETTSKHPVLFNVDGAASNIVLQLLDASGYAINEQVVAPHPQVRMAENVGEDGKFQFSPVSEPVLLEVPVTSNAASAAVSINGQTEIYDLLYWQELDDEILESLEIGSLGSEDSSRSSITVIADGFSKKEDFLEALSQWYGHCRSLRPFSHPDFANNLNIRWLFIKAKEGGTSFAIAQSTKNDRVYSGSSKLVRRLLEKSAIGFDPGMHAIVLANLKTEGPIETGGAGGSVTGQSSGWSPAWALSRSRLWLQTATHELGHAFGLVDEYSFDNCGGPAYQNIAMPDTIRNVTDNNEPDDLPLPWRDMLSAKQNNRWQGLYDYSEEIGIIEGAKYCNEGWFRSSARCLMRSIGDREKFCPVCTELIAAALDQT